MSINPRFIFTGGPGTGKTTVLDALRTRGCRCIPEVARSIIHERLALGLSPRPEPIDFANQILRGDVSNYDDAQTESAPVCFDRGMPDALGMLVECGEIDFTTALAYLKERPYNKVAFLFPFWEAIYEMDSERDQLPENADEVSDRMRRWYIDLGFSLVEVPMSPVEDRIDFILKMIGQRLH
jgi:predicted ATPase